MKTSLFLISLLFLSCSGRESDTDPLDEEFGVDNGKTDNTFFAPDSTQAQAILSFVNQPLLSKQDSNAFEILLDSKLNRIAAKNVVKYRVGGDEKVGTSDDKSFPNLKTLDGVPFVGKFAIKALFELAKSAGYVVEKNTAKRIILFVGDGMGVGAISGTQYLADQKLEMLSMPEMGWMSTHSHEFVTTDSAASASALASGRKTHFNGIGVIPGTETKDEEDPNHHLESFFDLAKTQGWGRGIVSTSRVVHATPAAFYAHRKTRKSYQDIAQDLVPAELDVVLGAGWQYFRARSDRADLVKKLKDDGVDYFEDPTMIDALADRSTRMMGLFYKKDMPLLADQTRTIPLAKMVKSAIQVLDRGHPEGWVLMVEGSFIDWCEHDLRPNCTFLETKDFDEAVGVGRDYADTRHIKDTLIVVTADHETGGLSIINNNDAQLLAQKVQSQNPSDRAILKTIEKGEGFEVGSYFSGNATFTASFGSMSQGSALLWNRPFFKAAHTPNFVPIFAEGPSAKFIASSKDNALLGLNLKRMVAGGGFAQELNTAPPKNMVLFLGEGLGISALTLGKYSEGKSPILEMEEHALLSPEKMGGGPGPSTYALLSGRRTFNKKNLIALALQKGKSVGIISNRFDGTLLKIAGKNSEKVDFILGFDDQSPSKIQAFKNKGYRIEDSWPPTLNGPTFGHFGSFKGATAQTQLVDTFTFARERLSQNPKGFLLLLDLRRSDKEEDMLVELKNLNATLQQSLEDTSQTLVLLTGDRNQTMSVIDNHYGFEKNQCGAASRCGGDFEYEEHEVVQDGGFSDTQLQGSDFSPRLMLQYAWLVRASAPNANSKNSEHTYSENFLPLFASGVGASSLRAFHSQKEIGAILSEFIK